MEFDFKPTKPDTATGNVKIPADIFRRWWWYQQRRLNKKKAEQVAQSVVSVLQVFVFEGGIIGCDEVKDKEPAWLFMNCDVWFC